MAALGKQQNFAVNTNKSQLYIEDSTNPLSYNYKTDQWSVVADYAGIGLYSVDSGVNIGLARVSGTAVDLQQPDTSDPKAEAIITTGEATFSDGMRKVITGVRPLVADADAKVSIQYRDRLNQSGVTNYLLHSEDFSNAAWTKSNVTVSANVTTPAPDGEQTADLIVGDGSGTGFYVEQTSQTHADNSIVYVSFYFYYVTQQYLKIWYDATHWLVADIQNFAGTGASNVEDELIFAGSEKLFLGNWGRYRLAFNSTDTTTTPRIEFCNSSGTALTDVSTSVLLWGASVSTDGLEYTKTTTVASAGDLFSSQESDVNSRSGVAPFRVDARYHRIRLRLPAESDYTTILGADVHYEPSGEV